MMLLVDTRRGALHKGEHGSFVAKEIALACKTEQALLESYHLAVTRFLKSCGNNSDNFIGGVEELALREAWANAENYLSTL